VILMGNDGVKYNLKINLRLNDLKEGSRCIEVDGRKGYAEYDPRSNRFKVYLEK
jgi:hypothetical protein